MRGRYPGGGDDDRVRIACRSGTAVSASPAGDSGIGADDSAGTGSHGCGGAGRAGGDRGPGCGEHTTDGGCNAGSRGRGSVANRRAYKRSAGSSDGGGRSGPGHRGAHFCAAGSYGYDGSASTN